MPRAGIRKQDWPDDHVLTLKEPGHHSPLPGGATPGLDQVMLTEGTMAIWLPGLLPAAPARGTEWFPEIRGSNVHMEAGQSMSKGRFEEEFIHPEPAKAHGAPSASRLRAGVAGALAGRGTQRSMNQVAPRGTGQWASAWEGPRRSGP